MQSQATDIVFAPLDEARAALYRGLAPLMRGLYANRALRVAVLGPVLISLSFAATVVAPLWTLALSPLLLGVPHLLADVRYLVVQPGLHRRGGVLALAVIPLVAVGLEAPPAVGLLAVGFAVLGARSGAALKVAALVVWGALTAAAWQFEWAFQLAFLHLHNVVALGLWWMVRPRGMGSAGVLATAAVGTVLLLTGALDPVVALCGGWSAPSAGAGLSDWAASNAPFAGGPLAARVVLSFAFLQSVHYAIWLRLIPEDARTRQAPRPFRASWKALRHDFGLAPLLVCGAIALGIAIWGTVDLVSARWGYLRLASFHGYLELAAGALLLLEGRTLFGGQISCGTRPPAVTTAR